MVVVWLDFPSFSFAFVLLLLLNLHKIANNLQSRCKKYAKGLGLGMGFQWLWSHNKMAKLERWVELGFISPGKSGNQFKLTRVYCFIAVWSALSPLSTAPRPPLRPPISSRVLSFCRQLRNFYELPCRRPSVLRLSVPPTLDPRLPLVNISPRLILQKTSGGIYTYIYMNIYVGDGSGIGTSRQVASSWAQSS